MGLEKRIENLEAQTGVGKKPTIIFVMYGDSLGPTEEERQQLIKEAEEAMEKEPGKPIYPIYVPYKSPAGDNDADKRQNEG